MGQVQINLPTDAHAEGCSTSFQKGGCTATNGPGVSYVDAIVDSLGYTGRLKAYKNASIYYQGAGVWDFTFQFTVQSADLGWDANGLNVESQIPAFSFTQQVAKPGSVRLTSVPGADDTHVTVTYGVPNAAGYDWTGGPAPYSAVSSSKYQPVGVTWIEPLSALSVAIPVDATDNSTVSLDNQRLFLAGALLGIGGGALVGAIQELTHRQDEAAPEPVRPPGPPPVPDAPVVVEDHGAGEPADDGVHPVDGPPSGVP
jgi:hypothetical protein